MPDFGIRVASGAGTCTRAGGDRIVRNECVWGRVSIFFAIPDAE